MDERMSRNLTRNSSKIFVLIVACAAALSSLAGHTSHVGSFVRGIPKLRLTKSTGSLVVSNMAPGGERFGSVTVANAGSASLRYTVAITEAHGRGPDLAAVLDGEMRATDRACSRGTFLASTTQLSPVEKLRGLTMSPARSLAAGAKEVVCLRVVLPLGVGDSYQRATTGITFAIAAVGATTES